MLDQMEAIFVLKHLYVREILEIFVKMYWKKARVRKKKLFRFGCNENEKF